MSLPRKQLFAIGILLELLIFALVYFRYPAIEDSFRYAARYSGRLSFLVFVYTFYLFAHSYPAPVARDSPVSNFISLFAVLHLIHWGFLAASVYLNAIPLETVKVIGGAFAYLLIVLAPFRWSKWSVRIKLLYFYYVSLVMALTFVARIKGEFPGASPYWTHYAGLALMALCAIVFGTWIYKAGKRG